MAAIESDNMECNKRNFDIVCKKVKSANAEMIRLKNCIDESNNANNVQMKIFNDKIKRLQLSIKIQEEQYESVVSDKFNATKMLSEEEIRCKALKAKMEEMTQENGDLKKNLKVLKAKVNELNFEMMLFSAEFDLLQDEENEAAEIRKRFKDKMTKFFKREGLERKMANRKPADGRSETNGNSVSDNLIRSSGAVQVHAEVTERINRYLVKKEGHKRKNENIVKFAWEPIQRKRSPREGSIVAPKSTTPSRPKRAIKCSRCFRFYTRRSTKPFCRCDGN